MQGLSPNVREQLMAKLATRPAPNRREFVRSRALLLVLAALPLIMAGLMRGVAWGRPSAFVFVSVSIATLVAAGGTFWVLRSGHSTLGRPRPLLRTFAVALPAFLLLLAGALALMWPETQTGASLSIAHDLPCFVMTLLLASAPFGAMMYLERRSDPVDPAATGAALGVAAGTWAGVAMALGCARSDLLHLGLAHILPLVVLALIGALVGIKVVGLRVKP